MRIVLAVHQFLPHHTAGTEILTYSTAKELQHRGHDVEVWMGFPADVGTATARPIETHEVDGLRVFQFNHCFDDPALGGNPTLAEYNHRIFAAHFRRHLRSAPPDVVHFFHFRHLSASPIDVCYDLGIPTVFTPTDFWMICPTIQLLLPDNSLCTGPNAWGVNCIRHVFLAPSHGRRRELFHRLPDWGLRLAIAVTLLAGLFSRRARRVKALAARACWLRRRMNRIDRVLVPTMLMERFLVTNGLDPRLVKFAPYGIDLAPFAAAREKVRTAARLRVGFIGTLHEHKAPHLLCQALRALPRELPLDLKIYGKALLPEYGERLRQIAGDDPRIQFCGEFPNAEIGRIFSGLDVLVVPSIWYENTPLVIYSAQAARTPVVATNLGGMAEVVKHDVNGLLFEKGDVGGLAAQLRRLIEEAGLLERLSANVTSPQSIVGYADVLEETYKRVIAERGKTWRGSLSSAAAGS